MSDAGHVWNTTARDFGIDGHIEFVDADKQVTGFSVAAQVKGTEVGFPGENPTGFRFTCDADRIDYWLRYGRPVVLICVNLPQQRAWWKRLDMWFADPARRAHRVVEFDKAADRFDLAAFSSLATLGVPVGQPLLRLKASERLMSNLLEVTGFGPDRVGTRSPRSGYHGPGHRWPGCLPAGQVPGPLYEGAGVDLPSRVAPDVPGQGWLTRSGRVGVAAVVPQRGGRPSHWAR